MKKICILGMGYIGLPTASMLANNGYEVLGIDADNKIVEKLNSGKIHIDEPDLNELFLKAFKNGRIKISKEISKCDVYIIAVQTPLNHQNKADLSYVVSASEMIKSFVEKDNLVILESTSPPGTTRNVVSEIIFNGKGLKAGDDYYLTFCPERVLPGKIVNELINNDRIIGGINEISALKAKEIYSSFVKGDIYLTNLETAEIVKLAENTFRDINIAYANELTLICSEYKVSVWDVIKLANMHPRVNILNPGPGVGGHCIPVDPWFLIEGIEKGSTLIEKSREINNSMPVIISKKIIEIVGKYENPKVTFFGISYKENVGDTRESPAITIYNELTRNKIKVAIFDPLVSTTKYKISDLEESLSGSDLLLLFVGHKIFRDIKLENISVLMRNKNIFDTKNFYNKAEVSSLGFNYFSI